MRVDIAGKNLDITQAIRDHIESRFDKLEKWQVPLINPHAVISEEPNRQFKVEATVSVPNANLVASASHEDLYAAVNEMIHKLERQINKKQHKGEARRATHGHKEEVIANPE